jgi:hypothetical protein
VLAVLSPGASPHSKLFALNVIRHLSMWDSLELLLAAAAIPDAFVRAEAIKRLDAWPDRVNREFALVSRAKAGELRAAVASLSLKRRDAIMTILSDPNRHTN